MKAFVLLSTFLATQTGGVCVDQIPPGSKPPPVSPPVLRVTPSTGPIVAKPLPPGIYVQIASAATQEDAIKSGLELSQRLGRDRPAFIRGVTQVVEGKPRIVLFAGPFADEGAVGHFCATALAGGPCQARVFSPESQKGGPDPRRAQGKGD